MDITAGTPVPPAGAPAPVISGTRVDWTPRDVLKGVILFIVAFVVVPLAVALPLLAFYPSDSTPYLAAGIAASAPVYIALAFIAARMTFMKYGGGWERLGVRRPTGRTFAWAGAAIAGALAVSYAYAILVSFVGPLQQHCADQIPQDIRGSALLLAMSGFLAVVFAPIGEELFFRGFIFPGLARGWGVPAGIVASGILFGSAHVLGNPVLYKSVIQFAAIGMVLAYCYSRSGNIMSTMMAHVTFNLLGIITVASTTCHS